MHSSSLGPAKLIRFIDFRRYSVSFHCSRTPRHDSSGQCCVWEAKKAFHGPAGHWLATGGLKLKAFAPQSRTFFHFSFMRLNVLLSGELIDKKPLGLHLHFGDCVALRFSSLFAIHLTLVRPKTHFSSWTSFVARFFSLLALA
jgi:hypothetical protein